MVSPHYDLGPGALLFNEIGNFLGVVNVDGERTTYTANVWPEMSDRGQQVGSAEKVDDEHIVPALQEGPSDHFGSEGFHHGDPSQADIGFFSGLDEKYLHGWE